MLVPVGECKVLLVLRVKKHHKGTSPFIIDQIWDKPKAIVIIIIPIIIMGLLSFINKSVATNTK